MLTIWGKKVYQKLTQFTDQPQILIDETASDSIKTLV